MAKGLPEITHLQYLALGILREVPGTRRWLSGETFRDRMRDLGAGHRSLPAWYQFFGRLEEAGFIKSQPCKTKNEAGGITYVANYRLLKKGERALAASRRFYCDDECGS